LSGYKVAGSDELDNEEKERRSPGCFFEPVLEKSEEFSVEELGVEGLSVESWLLDADFFGDGVGRAYGWKGVLSIVRSLRCKRCDSLPSSEISLSRNYNGGNNQCFY
jgi:hypothetical protein